MPTMSVRIARIARAGRDRCVRAPVTASASFGGIAAWPPAPPAPSADRARRNPDARSRNAAPAAWPACPCRDAAVPSTAMTMLTRSRASKSAPRPRIRSSNSGKAGGDHRDVVDRDRILRRPGPWSGRHGDAVIHVGGDARRRRARRRPHALDGQTCRRLRWRFDAVGLQARARSAARRSLSLTRSSSRPAHDGACLRRRRRRRPGSDIRRSSTARAPAAPRRP